MSNYWIDPQMTSDLKSKAEHILRELDLGKSFLRVRYNGKLLTFTQDRRVVEVPPALVDQGKWSDIRFLFRAVLNSAPSAWNHTADDNDWSAFKKHSYE